MDTEIGRMCDEEKSDEKRGQDRVRMGRKCKGRNNNNMMLHGISFIVNMAQIQKKRKYEKHYRRGMWGCKRRGWVFNNSKDWEV